MRAAAGVVSVAAAGSLVAGFAVAQLTGVRWLGGLVLVAAAVWCATQWSRAAGRTAAVGLVVLYGAAFVGSHLLARAVGAWPAVLSVAALVGAVSYAVTGRRSTAPA